jgi:hypothetical protein
MKLQSGCSPYAYCDKICLENYTMTVKPESEHEVTHPTMQPGISTDAVPPLQSGDRLTRREFESRYETTPEKFKAELVEGVVYVAQPTSIYHARPHGFLMRWLGTYMAATPGLDLADTVTLRLDLDNEVQPDAVLRIDKSLGGQSAVSEEGYLEGRRS